MDNDNEKPYFAPSAPAVRSFEDRMASGLTTTRKDAASIAWGEDAAEIARQAGLGSYGAELATQEQREEVLLRTLEAVRGEFAGLRSLVLVLVGAMLVLAAAVAWLLVAAWG